MPSARAALERLKEGNRRFVSGVRSLQSPLGDAQREALVSGQHPFAIVLGCSDSRVPAEVVFDQGLGALFVIRVAGNIVAPSGVGSVEFAASRFGTRLVVVLGHTRCGAVLATVEEIEGDGRADSPGLRSIVERIRPAVAGLIHRAGGDAARDRDSIVGEAVRENVRASVEQLRHGSPILEQLIANDGLRVVGAEYSLETGEVAFFDEAP